MPSFKQKWAAAPREATERLATFKPDVSDVAHYIGEEEPADAAQYFEPASLALTKEVVALTREGEALVGPLVDVALIQRRMEQVWCEAKAERTAAALGGRFCADVWEVIDRAIDSWEAIALEEIDF